MLAPLLAGGVLVALALLLCHPGTEAHNVVGEVGGNVTLQCGNVSLGANEVEWLKSGNDHPVLSLKWPDWNVRFTWGNQSSLQIKELQLQDEGNYTCSLTEDETNSGFPDHHIQLLLARGPSKTSLSISPNRTLPNGTLYTPTNSILYFSCATDAYPVPSMEWSYYSPIGTPPETFSRENETVLNFTLFHIGPTFQGNYSCAVKNWLNLRKQELAVELLIYWQPKSPPSCWAETSQAGSMVDLFCVWAGGYPQPIFQWSQEETVLGHSESDIAGIGTADQFVVTLNKTQLQTGKQYECRGSHILQKEAQTCTMRITLPTLEPQPMKTCFSEENVTLVCLSTATNPPANFTWLKNLGLDQFQIQPSEKYQITQNATSSLLTILNCSSDPDEGYYVCRAENPLGVRELDVWLAVYSPRNIVGIVIALVILFLFTVGSITVFILYCNPEFCLKGKSRGLSHGAGDVMVLMDSDVEDDVVDEVKKASPDDTRDTVQAANGNIRHAVICHHVPEKISETDGHSGLSGTILVPSLNMIPIL
ncbi:V-set and immunoglobulin domain-containing protein 10 [Ambystoma mexicanum]|uniref:V-set and immunoglobulin domain-containing protein 10 n=1 Tax=Ambystoma mexicanum TaxID=8296 RepID=UPI0037E94E68